MKCFKCGEENVDGAKFCLNCGSVLEQPVYSQINVPQGNEIFNNSNLIDNNHKSSKNVKKIILICSFVILIVIFVIIFNVFKNKNNNDSIEEDYSGDIFAFDEEEFVSSSSFFFKNDDNTYTLYDENGEKLTKDNYIYVTDFLNGVAVVQKENNEYGLIKEDGTMLLDYSGDFEISSVGPFFEVTSDNYSKIYDSNGNIIMEGKGIYGRELIYGYHQALIIRDSMNFYIFNYKGVKVATIPLVEYEISVKASSIGSYLSLYYNNKSYVINTNSKLLFTLDDEYVISDVSKDGKQFLLMPYSEMYKKLNTHHYKLVKNGKIVSNLEIDESVTFDNNIIKGDYKLYDEKGEIRKSGIYYDENNYVLKNEKNKYDLYENGKLKTTLNCDNTYFKIVKERFYIMENCDNQIGKTFYDLEGTKLNDRAFKSAREFDNYGLAIVSYDGENYFLMNTKGEKISNEYEQIELVYENQFSMDFNKDVYIATKNNQKILLNVEGKELISGDNIEVYYNLALVERDERYEIFNIDKNKKIIILDVKPTLYENYFTYEQDGMIWYCAYGNGKVFEKKFN